MTISDEKLSAFLDAELPEQEMAELRSAMQRDETLAERLADLVSSNEAFKRYTTAIDCVPMPESVLQLLRSDDSQQTAKVVHISRWQQARRRLTDNFREHAALAASIALVAGFAGGQFIGSNPTISPATGLTAAVAATLDSTASGASVSVGGDATFLAHFSFSDNQARVCRQFSLQEGNNASENLACRSNAQWELIATARASSVYRAGEYQPASGANLLDSTLDALMQGAALTLDEEAQLLQRQ